MQPKNDDQNPVPTPTQSSLVDTLVRLYASKRHLLIIVLGIVFSGIHLKFAIQYLGQCTIQTMINIYIIVHASVTILLLLFAFTGFMTARCIYPRSGESSKRTVGWVLYAIVGLKLVAVVFGLIWLVIGSVWVFGVKVNGAQESDATITATFCSSDLFESALIMVTVWIHCARYCRSRDRVEVRLWEKEVDTPSAVARRFFGLS